MLRVEQAQNLTIRGKNPSSAQKIKKAPSFKGTGSAVSSFFSMIQTHEVAGPTVVNITSMVVPRTAVDLTRSKEAGLETARRETTSLVSSSLLPGFYALGIGGLLGMFNNKLGVTSQLMTSNETVDMFKEFWAKASKGKSNKDKILNKFVRDVLKSSGFSSKDAREIAEKLRQARQRLNTDKKLSKNRELKPVIERAVELTGVEQKLNVTQVIPGRYFIKTGKTKSVETSMKKLITDLYDLPKELFLKYEGPRLDAAVEKFKSLGKQKGALGFSLAAVIAVSTQFVNRYITKQETGSDAFVGLPDYKQIAQKHIEPQKQHAPWQLAAEKAASVLAMGYMLGATYAGSLSLKKIWDFAKKPANIFDKLKFKSKFVTLNQLRALSAITISGRILASADVNELRETDARDFLGFLNWLVFGGFVAKLTGAAMDKRTLNKANEIKGANWWQRAGSIINKTFLKTDGEIKAMTGITDGIKKKLIRNKNIAIGAGLLYSISFLGLGVPIINKFMTNKLAANKLPQTDNKQNKTDKKETFNKNMLLVEETLGKLSEHSVSSAFFYPLNREDPFAKFKQKSG